MYIDSLNEKEELESLDLHEESMHKAILLLDS